MQAHARAADESPAESCGATLLRCTLGVAGCDGALQAQAVDRQKGSGQVCSVKSRLKS